MVNPAAQLLHRMAPLHTLDSLAALTLLHAACEMTYSAQSMMLTGDSCTGFFTQTSSDNN